MLILSDSGVLTAATQLFLLNSIATRQRTAPSWAAAGGRLFTTRASISVSPMLVGFDTEDGSTLVRRACIGSVLSTSLPLSALAPAQRAGAQRLRAVAQTRTSYCTELRPP